MLLLLIEMGRNNELYDYFVLKHMHSDDKGFMVLCKWLIQCILLLSILATTRMLKQELAIHWVWVESEAILLPKVKLWLHHYIIALGIALCEMEQEFSTDE
jgi:hypothetical protein